MASAKNLLHVFLFFLFSVGLTAQNTQKENPVVLIKTSEGDIKVMLYNDTPRQRDNFLKLAGEGYYDGRIFHRVIKNFMIQAGWTEAGVEDPDYKIEAEIRDQHFHKKGALAAARQGDRANPERKSSGCQFYIVHGRTFNKENLSTFEARLNTTFTEEQKEIYSTVGGAPHLDGSYTVFGEVIEGLEVVDKIAAVPTAGANKPVNDITIISMKVLDE